MPCNRARGKPCEERYADEQQAKKIIGEIVERTTGEPLRNYKVRDWLDQWLDMKEQVRAGKTMDRYRQVMRDFIASLGSRANLALAHVTPKDVLAYRNSITKAGKDSAHSQSVCEGSQRSVQRSSSPGTSLKAIPLLRWKVCRSSRKKRGHSRPPRWRSSCAQPMVIGGGQFCLATTLARGLVTWRTCAGARLIGAIRSSDLRRAKREKQ